MTQKDPQTVRGASLEDDNYRQPVFITDLMSELSQLLAKHYTLVYEPGGYWGGINFYRRDYLELPGMETPEGFWLQKAVIPGTTAAKQLKKTLNRVITAEVNGLDKDDPAKGKWFSILGTFMDRPSDEKSPVAKLAASEYATDADKPATVAGAPGAFKVVPQVDWFSPEVQAIDPRGLLTLFPDAEAEVLMLLLGRVMVGATATNTAEGPVKHTARSYGVIVGTDPGLGKSTFLGWLEGALVSLGYRTAAINTALTRFGWGPVAVSDLATIDDLTAEVQGKLLKDVRVKSVVSNNKVTVEEKGVPAYDVRARSVILAATNLTDYRMFLKMDPGSLNRLNQLDTYTAVELEKVEAVLGTDPRIKQYWEHLARETDSSPETIMCWLLANCAQKFLEVTGHRVEKGSLVRDYHKDRLQKTMTALRKQLRIDTGLYHVQELVENTARMVALARTRVSHPPDLDLFDQGLAVSTYTAPMLAAVLELYKIEDQTVDGLIPWEHMAPEVKGYIAGKVAQWRGLKNNHTLEKAFQVLAGELKSTKGFGYPLGGTAYHGAWVAAKKRVPNYQKAATGFTVSSRGGAGAVLDNVRDHLIYLSGGS